MQHEKRTIDKKIAALAFPALGSLVAEPLFIAVDSALVGHLGAVPLAGLAVAAAILTTIIGLMIFLAYSTTPLVARRRGAGDIPGAVQAGIDGIWLAFGLGILVALFTWLLKDLLISGFGAETAVADQASIYLGISSLGMPAMLIVFAATGLLRGLLDTVTPLYIATIGFTVNALLNWFFIYGLGLGIAGSAWGTVLAQWGMVVVYLFITLRLAKREKTSLLPQLHGLKHAGKSGGWLFIRTVGLRIALLSTVVAATSHGAAATAGYQIVFTIVSITAFSLDALAIAAQALVGDALGAGDRARVTWLLKRTLFWGIATGVVIGLILAGTSPIAGRIFTSDPAILELLPPALIAVGLTLPLGAVVYVLDGVLMGAGDMRYLAVVSILSLIIYLPVLWLVTVLVPTGTAALLALTLAFTLFLMLLRALTLLWRIRGDKWMVTDSHKLS